ncbi:hypothetical protein [Methanosarcina acetivorans]|uniref:hypothetical protein n=1 Tax=Methanosarcina acetivorans TaxID=2214 RepID=UPI001D03E7D4|nr:hypothetical protein [Methanosarcina acetivorans]
MSSPDLSVLVLLGVLSLTALLQVGSLRLQTWQVMTLGALLVLLLGEISPQEALHQLTWTCSSFYSGPFVWGKRLTGADILPGLGAGLFQGRRIRIN